jgi:hypothetical protein
MPHLQRNNWTCSSNLQISELSEETRSISYGLLRFPITETSGWFRTKSEPIQADQDFHLNLNYEDKAHFKFGLNAIQYLEMLKGYSTYVSEHLVLLKAYKKISTQPKGDFFSRYESAYNTHIVSDY